MVFNSIEFLIFIVAFFPLYFSSKGIYRVWICLIFSYIFYGWWDWRFLGLIMLSTSLDYGFGLWMYNTKEETKQKQIIWLSVIVNLSLLGFFKYFNFFIDSFVMAAQSIGFNPSPRTLNVLLPIGISFYTFQSMSYTIDIYRKEFKPELNFIRFASFVALFPQLVAGPIVRARDFLPQYQQDKPFSWDNFTVGLARIIWGFFKKVAIADSLAPFVDQCFESPGSFSSMHLSIGVIFYSFQIYCDFSGYSDIAIGLARMMGFEFLENFKTPYFSQSFSEFWTRWHISLSSWLRDYLYIPLGGNRGGSFMTYRNLMITMLLGGIWHGANWAFIVWGLLHGLYLVVQRLCSPAFRAIYGILRVPSQLQVVVNVLVVYFFTLLAWVFFRGGSMGTSSFSVSFAVLDGIADFSTFKWETVINKFTAMKGFLLIFILVAIEFFNLKYHFTMLALRNPVFRVVSYAAVFWLILFFGTFGSKSFIYFQF